jgi:putative endonuclease
MYYLYILLCDKAFFYTGITNNLDKRIKEHKSGHSFHTKRYSSIELVYTETYPIRLKAELREKQIKGWTNKKKKALIEGNFDKLKKSSKSKPEIVED